MKGGKAKNEASSTLKKVEEKPIGKRKTAAKESKVSSRQEKKGRKAAKDPNKPKRPASAFFVFMEDFRKTYKEKNPNVKSVSVVGKAGGDKWKSMSEADKAPYVAKAGKRKTEYEKNMAAYNNKQTSTAGDSAEESDKSKSEVNDEDDEESGEDDDAE
jgi:high mobility group protein B1|uniref:HMG box domain-containing protein n=1 Tax=Picea sitchensis TaxID=3332 RepID=A9NK65_PICSI|nr:unknown [Picea sitchensis]ABK22556.1 unknown [Picea sitchensis]ABK22606.1 unknown [Picea sitchensis]ABK22657.1 unknown [Picea sitchensis]ABK22712.1 unknown [Picea sitchensis]